MTTVAPVSARSELWKLRRQNPENKWFIPIRDLNDWLDTARTRTILDSIQIDVWQQAEITETIVQGARRLFAILILIKEEILITRFVAHDAFRDSDLDSQLPLPPSVLQEIIPENADEFWERQWELCSPVFVQSLSHRILPPHTKLPFLASRNLGEGGFGLVFDVTIAAGHHRFDDVDSDKDSHFALKHLSMLDASSSQSVLESWRKMGANEHIVLSLLDHLRHPCILKLRASFSYQQSHCLLFDLATGNTLQHLLSSDTRPSVFGTDSDLFSALAGLASAVDTLHTFRSSLYGLELIGYHHDLKPANILVSGEKFILADFGLSRFKQGDDSKTSFKVGRGYYLAPECEDFEQGFTKGVIGRSSDIWSLGCILLEVLIYMRYGTYGVQQFSQSRKIQVGTFVTRTFFTGSKLNAGVESWLDKIHKEQSTVFGKAVSLIRSILVIEPDLRLNAGEINTRLRTLTTEELFLTTYGMFQTVFDTCDATNASI